MPGKLYILTGPSGVGKTTVAKELLKRRPHLEKVVTTTTRPPREGETNGKDYHFISEQDFETLISENALFEWAKVYDHYYGSRRSDVETLLESGKDVLMVIDVQGAKTIHEQNKDALIIFLTAASPELLLERLERRDEGSTEHIEQRKAALENELAFQPLCNFTVENKEGELEKTVDRIESIMDSRAS